MIPDNDNERTQGLSSVRAEAVSFGPPPATRRVAVVSSHPIQYHVPLFKRLASRSNLDLTVYFGWNSIGRHDPQFGRAIAWDVPLLEGYRYQFLPNWSPTPGTKWFGQLNPMILPELARGRFDAVLVHGYTNVTSLLTLMSAWVTGTPILLRGEANLLERRAPWRRALKRAFLPLVFSRVNAILYSCSTNRGFYEDYGVPEEKLFFTPCAVDNAYWRAESAKYSGLRDQIRTRYGIPPDRLIILYAGKLVPWKRPADLLRALERLPASISPWLIVAGEGSERGKLERHVVQQGIHNVTFTGFLNQSQVGALYAVADVFVLPSQRDPSPKVINEAMNFALPIITTDKVGTATDLVRAGDNGCVYRAGNVEELVKSLRDVLSDPEKMRSMGQRSLEIVSEWSLDANADAIVHAVECVGARRQESRS